MSDTEERDIEDAIGFRFINGDAVPIFETTPQDEREFYAAGDIGPEGLTICHSRPRESKQ